MDEIRVWGIHTQNDSLFLDGNVIAIGWKEIGDLRLVGSSRDDFKKRCMETYQGTKERTAQVSAGMLYRFLYEVKIGDYVVFPSKSNREINIGIIESEYIYVPTEREYVQQRKVKWLKHLPRTEFSQGALAEIGSIMSLFSVKNYADEFMKMIGEKPIKTDIPGAVAITKESVQQNTEDFILKELSRKLKGYDLENFVANLLEAMGYRTEVSAHGGDRGVDIIAYKDELPPRILVQVKSADGNIEEAKIQAFRGAMSEGDYGVFVCLSQFTKNAQKYLDNNPRIKGIDGGELTKLIMKYYEKLDTKYKEIIPLEQVYIPTLIESL